MLEKSNYSNAKNSAPNAASNTCLIIDLECVYKSLPFTNIVGGEKVEKIPEAAFSILLINKGVPHDDPQVLQQSPFSHPSPNYESSQPKPTSCRSSKLPGEQCSCTSHCSAPQNGLPHGLATPPGSSGTSLHVPASASMISRPSELWRTMVRQL